MELKETTGKIEIGANFGDRYRLVRLLGEGSHGAVYLAFDSELDRQVAIKLIHSFALIDSSNVQRFQREALALSRLNHPGIVRIYQFGKWNDRYPYLVMEYVGGGDLKTLLKEKGNFGIEETRKLAVGLAEALEAAHGSGIVHRDLKPQNLLFDLVTGQFKICDFGLCKVESVSTDTITETGQVLGTLPYMSPEQFFGRQIDGRSDIYSLACIIYEMLTGLEGFSQADPMVLFQAKSENALPSLRVSLLELGLNADFDQILQKASSPRAASRQASAGELVEELKQVIICDHNLRLVRESLNSKAGLHRIERFQFLRSGRRWLIFLVFAILISMPIGLGLALTSYSGQVWILEQGYQLLKPKAAGFETLVLEDLKLLLCLGKEELVEKLSVGLCQSKLLISIDPLDRIALNLTLGEFAQERKLFKLRDNLAFVSLQRLIGLARTYREQGQKRADLDKFDRLSNRCFLFIMSSVTEPSTCQAMSVLLLEDRSIQVRAPIRPLTRAHFYALRGYVEAKLGSQNLEACYDAVNSYCQAALIGEQLGMQNVVETYLSQAETIAANSQSVANRIAPSFFWGDYYCRRGDLVNAEKYLYKIMDFAKQSSLSGLQQSQYQLLALEILFLQGRYADAASLYPDNLIEPVLVEPNHLQNHTRLRKLQIYGICLARSGQAQKAAKFARVLWRRAGCFPDTPVGMRNEILAVSMNVLQAAGQYMEALSLAQIDLPLNGRVEGAKASIYLAEGDSLKVLAARKRQMTCRDLLAMGDLLIFDFPAPRAMLARDNYLRGLRLLKGDLTFLEKARRSRAVLIDPLAVESVLGYLNKASQDKRLVPLLAEEGISLSALKQSLKFNYFVEK